MKEPRTVSHSRTIQTYVVLPAHLNAAGNLFGGQLLSWIDMTAGITAMRHADSAVVTAAIDNLVFLNRATGSDVITLDGRVTRVGNTSMEVRVDTYRENKGGQKYLINTAFLVMVSLDDNCVPQKAPGLIVETEEEKAELEAAEKRTKLRAERRKANI